MYTTVKKQKSNPSFTKTPLNEKPISSIEIKQYNRNSFFKSIFPRDEKLLAADIS